jgi:hypothetical protein
LWYFSQMAGRFLLWAILVLSVTNRAYATVMPPLDVEGLTKRAERVVVGKVESSTSYWTTDHDAIFTEVAIRVDHSMKGLAPKGSLVVVRHEGGSIGGIGMRVFGAAQFHVGEEVVVFLETRAGAPYVVGMTQGKMRIVRDPAGVKIVKQSFEGIDFAPSPSHERARSLEELENEVHRIDSRSQRSRP